MNTLSYTKEDISQEYTKPVRTKKPIIVRLIAYSVVLSVIAGIIFLIAELISSFAGSDSTAVDYIDVAETSKQKELASQWVNTGRIVDADADAKQLIKTFYADMSNTKTIDATIMIAKHNNYKADIAFLLTTKVMPKSELDILYNLLLQQANVVLKKIEVKLGDKIKYRLIIGPIHSDKKAKDLRIFISKNTKHLPIMQRVVGHF